METLKIKNLIGLPKKQLDRFLKRIRVVGECWLWMGSCSQQGYGIIYWHIGDEKADVRVHRLAWSLQNGPIPFGHHIHHKCQHLICCNPDHLECLSPSEHAKEQGRLKYTRTHCQRGHEFTEENTAVSKRGKRKCRTCDLQGRRRLYREKHGLPKEREFCVNGHEFTPENTFRHITPQGYSSRGCKECRKAVKLKGYIKKKAELEKKLPSIKPKEEYCMHGHQYSIFGFSVSRTGQIRCKQCTRDSANKRNALLRDAQPKEPKTECANGHSLEEFGFKSSEGRVRCRECHRLRSLEYVERRRAELAAAGTKYVQKTRKPHVFKTHCPKGHPYANPQQGSGRKHCPQCMVESLSRRGVVRPL